MKLLDELINLLKKDERLISDDKLLKNRIVELALKLDKDLLKLLMSNNKIKEHFFIEIDNTLVFDKEKFMKFVDNKEFLPDSYTAFKNKIGLTADKKYLAKSKEVVLSWPYKDCILEGGQEKEDEKRKEVFHNEILAPDEIDRLLEPKVFTNFIRLNAQGDNKVTDIKPNDNLIIKGNNLLVLHSLKKKYAGKVKLIYIDPPYNTGSDSFKYNDNFNHSTWLSFMKNRLEIAKKLLKDDGFIFVQCDDHEQAYLKVLMDEIFGKENNRSIIYVETVYSSKTLKQDRVFHDQIEQILVYARSQNSKIKQEFEEYSYDKFCWYISEKAKPLKVMELGNKKVEIFARDSYEIKKGEPSKNGLKEVWASGTILDMNSSGRFFRDYLMNRNEVDGLNILYKIYGIGDDKYDFRYFTGPKKQGATKGKYYQGVPTDKIDVNLSEIKKKSIENFWPMAGDFGNCRLEGGVELKSGKKPEKLIKQILEMSTEKGDIVLDYHLGSGTTCAVAHKMDRNYIGVEQLNYGKNDSVIRLKNVIGKSNSKGKLIETIEDYDASGISKDVNWKGSGDFVYCELKQLNEDFVQRIKKAKDSKELFKIWDEMKKHAFLSYRLNEKLFDENIEDFKELSAEEQKKLLFECLDANNLYVNYSEMQDSQYRISKEEKEINEMFYGSF